MGKFETIARKIPDARSANAQHELWEVLFVALAAMLCGAKSCCDMALFGRSKQALLRRFLPLRRGIPSHDTFSRVFRLIDPQAFETMFRAFMAEFVKANGIKLAGVVAIDGKALRGAYERGKSSTPLQMVNVFATQARLALAVHKAPGRNEASGALEVLAMLSLEGCIVTADALHCHRRFAAAVRARDAHFVLALKQNQAKLYAAVARRFARSGARSSALRREPSTHDRTESRRATVIRDSSVAAAQRFPGVVALARVTSRRRCHGKRAGKPVVHYYLLSKYLPAKRLLTTVRSHWGIENELHWVLDVTFDEDANRSRKDNAPENLAILRRLAFNIARTHPDRISMRQKIKRAAWDEDYLLAMLTHMR
jgi:predicted transposase YbfD/YdcC